MPPRRAASEALLTKAGEVLAQGIDVSKDDSHLRGLKDHPTSQGLEHLFVGALDPQFSRRFAHHAQTYVDKWSQFAKGWPDPTVAPLQARPFSVRATCLVAYELNLADLLLEALDGSLDQTKSWVDLPKVPRVREALDLVAQAVAERMMSREASFWGQDPLSVYYAIERADPKMVDRVDELLGVKPRIVRNNLAVKPFRAPTFGHYLMKVKATVDLVPSAAKTERAAAGSWVVEKGLMSKLEHDLEMVGRMVGQAAEAVEMGVLHSLLTTHPDPETQEASLADAKKHARDAAYLIDQATRFLQRTDQSAKRLLQQIGD